MFQDINAYTLYINMHIHGAKMEREQNKKQKEEENEKKKLAKQKLKDDKDKLSKNKIVKSPLKKRSKIAVECAYCDNEVNIVEAERNWFECNNCEEWCCSDCNDAATNDKYLCKNCK